MRAGEVDQGDYRGDYRPPSNADGTVSQGLIDGLQHLINEYGLVGVKRTLTEMSTPDEVNALQVES